MQGKNSLAEFQTFAANSLSTMRYSLHLPFFYWAVFKSVILESLSKRRFCQHGRQPEVSCVVTDGE